MTKAFKLSGLLKRYRDFTLGPLDLALEAGMVLGYVGPNGAGKTTTINIMAGLVRPERGSVEVFGRRADPNDAAWKLDVGYVGDEPVFYENWSGARNLRFVSQFYPDWSETFALELATRFRLPLEKRARELSKGNRVKLALVSVLARRPRLCLFDEPTAGLDPVVRAEVLEVLWELLAGGGRAIFYSTHNMSDLGALADELAFLWDGKILLRAGKDELTDRWRRISFRLAGGAARLEAAVGVKREGDDWQVISADGEATLRQLQSLGATGLQQSRLTVEEIAVQVLKGGGDVAAA